MALPTRSILAVAGVALAGTAAWFATRLWRREGERPAAAFASGKAAPGPIGHSGSARSAGPEAMRDPPAQWDETDQSSDESYPASDPPGISPKVD